MVGARSEPSRASRARVGLEGNVKASPRVTLGQASARGRCREDEELERGQREEQVGRGRSDAAWCKPGRPVGERLVGAAARSPERGAQSGRCGRGRRRRTTDRLDLVPIRSHDQLSQVQHRTRSTRSSQPPATRSPRRAVARPLLLLVSLPLPLRREPATTATMSKSVLVQPIVRPSSLLCAPLSSR